MRQTSADFRMLSTYIHVFEADLRTSLGNVLVTMVMGIQSSLVNGGNSSLPDATVASATAPYSEIIFRPYEYFERFVH